MEAADSYNISAQSVERQKMVIDTDAGVDDAMALLIAFACPNVDVVAVTCCSGNAHVDKVVKNVCQVISVCSVDIPVFRGACTSLLGQHTPEEFWHGADGLGDAGLPEAPATCVLKEHAVSAIVRLVNEHPGEITLVVLGPMTNVALAVRMDPSLPSKVKRLVFMGGSHTGRGNATFTAEFNTYSDPEAAYIVLHEFQCVMVNWDVTLSHCLDWQFTEQWMSTAGPKGDFLGRISRAILERSRTSEYSESGFAIPDPLAMCVAIEPTLVTDSITHFASVELGGTYSRGLVVIDWAGRHTKSEKLLTIVTKLDMDGVKRLLLTSVAPQALPSS
eukprot:GILK01000948.1.p1 GENE.GILK01000948.1~~GILK01000948.1.p1  ORF type:complete len:347 (-),score=37.18 GILK01000948.1:283-1278(-)